MLEIVPVSVTLAPSKMFLMAEAKYRYVPDAFEIDSTRPAITLSKSELATEFGKEKSVTVCFKSKLMLEDFERGLMNLFYTKIFEPAVEEAPSQPGGTEPIEPTEPSEPVIDAARVTACEELAVDVPKKIGHVYQYGVRDEGKV